MLRALRSRRVAKLPDQVKLQGRILFLAEDAGLVRQQLEGQDLDWRPSIKLRDNISTDEITPAYICYYYDETLGDFPYLGLKCGDAFPITRGSVKRGGFVASVSGIFSAPRHAAYGAAKAGLMSWVRSLAVELGPSGVRVNAVAPGMVWTPRVSGLIGARGRALVEERTPLRRMGEPVDFASAVLFFSTDLSSFVTGQTLVVDGGITNSFAYPMTALAELAGIVEPQS